MKDLSDMASMATRIRSRIAHLSFLMTRAMTLGVRGVVVGEGDSVLLVRDGYVSGWHFPGGGVEVGETCLDRAQTRTQGGGLRFGPWTADPSRPLFQQQPVAPRP